MEQSDIDLPYFDEILALAAASPAADLVRTLGTRHVHWGCYADAATRDDSVEGLVVAAEALTERLVALAGIADGQRVLDVGCGFGGTVAHLNESYSDMDLTGLNIDARQLERARTLVTARPGNRVTFVQGDASGHNEGLADGGFDRVMAVECIFHFPSRRRFFREARRLLRPGGRLVLSDFVPYGPDIPWLMPWLLLHRREMGRFYGTVNYFPPMTAWGYGVLAKLTGFRLVVDEDITANTLPTYPVLLRIFGEVGHAPAARATEHVAYFSRVGWVRYRLLAFEAV
jgi:SAM-dependent methyltransferase